MRMIIEAPFSMEDFIKLSIFMREMWKNRPELCFMFVTHGLEDLSPEECMAIFREVFTSDKVWKEKKMTKEVVDDFVRKIKGKSYRKD